MTLTTSAALAVIAVVVGVIVSLAMLLEFLWKVYDRGGPSHVLRVARALHQVYDPQWPAKILGVLSDTATSSSEASAVDYHDDEDNLA